MSRLTRRRVVAFPRSYRSMWLAMSWSCRRRVAARTRGLARRVVTLCRDTRPCRRPLPIMIQNLYCDPNPCRAGTAHSVARVAAPSVVSWRIASPYHSPGALYRDPKSPPSATIQFFFYRDPEAAQLTIQTLYRSILIWPGYTHTARNVAGLLRRVASTVGHIVAVPGRVVPLSWSA